MSFCLLLNQGQASRFWSQVQRCLEGTREVWAWKGHSGALTRFPSSLLSPGTSHRQKHRQTNPGHLERSKTNPMECGMLRDSRDMKSRNEQVTVVTEA